MADPRGEGGWGPVLPPPLFGFFSSFYKNKFTSKKLYLVLNEYEICLKMLEMAILETHIFKTFWGSMPPDPPRKLAPLTLIVPPPPLKVLDVLEISHTQQFFKLGISANQVKNFKREANSKSIGLVFTCMVIFH